MEKNALTFGMSTEEFWFGHPQTFYSYADVYVKKQEEKATELDYLAWRIGLYTMLGTNQCLSTKKTEIFPKKPFSYNENENKNKGVSLKDKIMAGVERHNAYIRAKKALQGE